MAVDLSPKRYGSKSLAKGAELTGEQIMSVANAITATKKANSVLDSYNRFVTAVETDTTGDNIFNASDFFEERKKQAEELKQRAAALSEYMANHQDSYTQESYDELMGILSTFDTNVDDVMSRYQPSLDSKAGMAAYEDEFIAAMERNAQLSKLDKMVDYAFDPGSPAASFMQSFRKYQNDESYRAVTDNWTEAERYELGLLQKEDPAKAREYAIQLNNFYNAKATEQNRQQIRDQATDNIFANTGKALAASIVGAGDIFDRVAEHAARGRTTEKEYLTATDYANETTGAINAYLNDRYGTVDTTGFQELRNIGQQGLQDSGVDPSYIGGAGNSLLDLASDMVDQKGVGDIYNFGYSLAQNLASRYTLGMVGGQPLVLANYFANAATSAIDDARRRGATGNQAMGLGLIKGALEVGTEFIPTSELFKMGPAVTVKDFLKAVGVEALEEFVGEGANALGGYIADQKIMGDLSEFETAKRTYMEQGMTEEQAHAQAIKDAVANIAFEGLSGALSGAVSGGAESAIRTGLANQYYRNVNPQPLIDAGMQTDTDSKAYQMATEMQQLVDEGQKISGNQKRVLAYNTEMQQMAQAKAAQETPAETEDISETPVQTPRVSTDGRAIQISTNEAIDALDFASLNKGKATIQLKSGETADYSDVSFASEAQANQFYAAASLPGIDTENANNLLHTIQDADAGKDVDSVVGIREAYGIGYFGMQESDLENGDAAKLSPELRKAVFDIGRQQRAADAMVKATAKPVTAKPSAGYKKVVFEGKTRQITKKQKSEIEFVDYIAENFSGNTVHVFESYKGRDGKYYYRDNNGKVHRAPNGKYVNGEIWLDLKSGDNQEGLVLNTFAHEMYHHIEKFDKTKAQELAEFVVKELGKKSVDDAVAEQIKKARKAGLGESYFQSRGMTAEQARNEVYMRAMSDFVADSLETMFTRGDPAKAIANLKKENRTLFDEIKAFIDKWVSKLKEFYSDKTISKEGELVAQLEKFEQLQQLFMEGVQSAGENYRDALKEPQKGTRKENVVQFSNRYAEQITEQDREYLASVNRGDMVVAQRMVDNEAKQWGAFLNNSEANEVFPQRGEVRTFYHGTNTGDFTVFDKGLLGNSSGDLGWFGKGFYFAFSADEANAYGGRVIRAYLKIKNPYDYSQLYKFKGSDRGDSRYARFAWLYNIVKQFPDIVTDQKVYAYPNDSEEGKAVSWKQLVRWMDRIEKDAKFSVAKVELYNGDTAWELRANPKQESFTNEDGETFTWTEYGMRQLFATEMDAKEPINQIGAYLVNVMGVESIPRRSIEKIDFSGAVQRAGYDGILQSPSGDEAVVFDPSQIKLADPVTYDDNGNVIPLSERFNPERDDIRYSLRNEKPGKKDSGKSYKAEQKDLIQKMQTEQRLIREELTGKKSDISIMEKEFIRLAKQYERLDAKTGKKSAKDARAITQLRTALKEEAKSHREDSKIWEREFSRLLRDYETAGRQIDRLEATIARQRATAKARVEGRRNTEMRHKIQRKVNELDQLLRHGSKHRNVPEFLQSSVAEVLNAINMEVRDGDQRRKTYEATLARYDRKIAATTDPAAVSRLIEKRNEYAAKGDQFANRMDTLKKAYDQIRKENTSLELDEGIAEHLNSLFETVGNTPLGQMTAAQMDAVNDILNVTMATVRNANEMLAEARAAGVVETSKSAITEIKSAGETKKKKTRFRKGLEQFGWNNLKPEYAIEVIGSKTLKARYDALRKGEDTLAVDLNEAKNFVQEQWKKNGGKDWDMEKKWKFTSTSGKSFELDLNQIMSLYALAKDKDARAHLRVGGFAFDNNYQTEENINLGPVKIPVKMESTDASAYNLSDEILGEIISKLTPQQRAFADAMQAYLSDTMAAKGNEVSLKKYGIRLFKKKDYFPIRVADQFMAKAREQQAGDRKLKDAGFTKDRKPEAKNPVVLSGFMKTWAEHVDEMSLYHSFVLPLDDFNRVLNYHDAFVEGEQAHSVVEAINNAFGDGAVKYLDQLIKDVNGGIKGGSTVSFANRMMSKAKKAQTMASLSVAIQQPSSILRAMSEVDSKYFLGPKVTEKTHDRTWNEIKAHAPIAIIKEMGGYDTNVGKSTVDYLTDTAEYNGFGEKFKAMFTDEKFRDDFLGRLPALMDEMSWGVIWNAVKREQSDLHPGMDVKSDAFMKMVAKRFTEVITRTQVYDSVFSRSGLMRDRKSDLAKMTTSFMAEPTTTANMLAVSILQAKRGDIPKKQAVKTTASIVASLALNAALVSVVYALRDDDEDKRYGEKWIENFYSNFFESLNPLGYIPYVRDIYNLFAKGYDVERADMELYGDLQNAIDGLDNDDLSAWEKTENVIGAIGNLVGVPLKNILRDSGGLAKTFFDLAKDDDGTLRIVFNKEPTKTKTGKYMARRGMDLSDGEEMILALQRGDEEHIQRVFGRFETQQKAESALQSAIGEQYKNGKLTAEEAEELLNTAFEREDEHEVYWIMDKWNYAIENGNSEGYAKYGKLYEAIENGGDYTAEMDRLMEHGSEVSEIRSQVTRKYHKQYLESDDATQKEIRDKIIPVLEAAGLDESEIEEKFSGWDFEVEYGMTYSEMKAEYRAGNVTEAEMRGAMKFTGMMNYEIEEDIRSLNEEIKFVNKYDMTLTEMKESYDDGNVTRNQMTNALVFSGMTQSEAQKWITQRDIENRHGIDYAKLDDAYKHNDISRTTLYNAMIENGATKQEADDAILGYDWLKKNVKKYPDMAISDAKKFAVRISTNAPDYTLEDFGVKVDDYIQYSKLRPDCKGVDNNGDGQADSGTKRDAIFKMIDSLPISSDAKDGLALIDYGMKSILKNAPWH